MDKLLCMSAVSLNYHSEEGETQAVKDLSFCLRDEEFLSVVGPSGCGKTTILSLLSGLIKATSGEVMFGDEVFDTRGGTVNPNIAYMLQRDHLFEWRTIRQNVMLGLEIKRKKTPQAVEYVDLLLEKYGLKDFANHYPRQLSGGMRQRVALIRTLATDPKLLLLDEPFSALDYQTRLKVCDDVYGIIKSEHKSAILVTHDISEAISMSDRILVLTKRPAAVRCEFEMDMSDVTTPLLRRECDRFGKWFDRIWKELNDEEK